MRLSKYSFLDNSVCRFCISFVSFSEMDGFSRCKDISHIKQKPLGLRGQGGEEEWGGGGDTVNSVFASFLQRGLYQKERGQVYLKAIRKSNRRPIGHKAHLS